MRKVREVLRLKHALRMSYRQIGEATGASKTQAAGMCGLRLYRAEARP